MLLRTILNGDENGRERVEQWKVGIMDRTLHCLAIAAQSVSDLLVGFLILQFFKSSVSFYTNNTL